MSGSAFLTCLPRHRDVAMGQLPASNTRSLDYTQMIDLHTQSPVFSGATLIATRFLSTCLLTERHYSFHFPPSPPPARLDSPFYDVPKLTAYHRLPARAPPTPSTWGQCPFDTIFVNSAWVILNEPTVPIAVTGPAVRLPDRAESSRLS